MNNLLDLAKIIWYEYPDMPIPHSGEAFVLEQLAVNPDEEKSCGLVVVIYLDDVYQWILEHHQPVLRQCAEEMLGVAEEVINEPKTI